MERLGLSLCTREDGKKRCDMVSTPACRGVQQAGLINSLACGLQWFEQTEWRLERCLFRLSEPSSFWSPLGLRNKTSSVGFFANMEFVCATIGAYSRVEKHAAGQGSTVTRRLKSSEGDHVESSSRGLFLEKNRIVIQNSDKRDGLQDKGIDRDKGDETQGGDSKSREVD